jgi:hypothetical protein
MKNLLAFLAALVVTVAGVGWYLGWFQLSTTPAAGGHERINIDVNTAKVSKDLQEGEKEVVGKGQELVEKARQEGKAEELKGPPTPYENLPTGKDEGPALVPPGTPGFKITTDGGSVRFDVPLPRK